jgi:DTW domain-containing protein YfiP
MSAMKARCTQPLYKVRTVLTYTILLLRKSTVSSLVCSPSDEKFFLNQVLKSVDKTLASVHPSTGILDLPPTKRQEVAVAKHLQQRIQLLYTQGDCPQCWLQQKHCICDRVKSLESRFTNLPTIYLLMHHKEIALVVDSAKLILASFPSSCRLVVAGLPDSLRRLETLWERTNETTWVLFPSDTSKTAKELMLADCSCTEMRAPTNIVVLDGTWEQAQRMHNKYIPSNCTRVCLSTESLETMGEAGYQLRKHPQMWRQISTLAATRMLLDDLLVDGPLDELTEYQNIADAAAISQLGPRRSKGKGTNQ